MQTFLPDLPYKLGNYLHIILGDIIKEPHLPAPLDA